MCAEERNQIYKKWKDEYQSRIERHTHFKSLHKNFLYSYAFILIFMIGAALIADEYTQYGFDEASAVYQLFIYSCPLFILILAVYELIVYRLIPDPNMIEIDGYYVFLSHDDFDSFTKVLAISKNEHYNVKEIRESTTIKDKCIIIGSCNL
ncbi:hypothetical protein UYO_1205 [Lachnospiraceae bacterium JC7]|nr:hypothetical protein UYO_1205 [Lachnospiraceae bacterium JC7]